MDPQLTPEQSRGATSGEVTVPEIIPDPSATAGCPEVLQCLLTTPCSAPSPGSWMLSETRISVKHKAPQERSGRDESSELKKPHATFETGYH